MDFLQRNLFIQLRSENFDSKEDTEPMTAFKKDKIGQMMKNLDDIPPGEVVMSNGFLNRRLDKIQNDERHAIDTSVETIHLLRLIVGNVNGILANGINLRGIIELGKYLRTRGDKVDFVKLERWLTKLHIQRMAQLEGSVLITFFDFEKDEIPFVRFVERGAYRHPAVALLQHPGTASPTVHAVCGRIRAPIRRKYAQESVSEHEILLVCPHRDRKQLPQQDIQLTVEHRGIKIRKRTAQI